MCRSECTYSADEATCVLDRCDALFRQCVAALPVGKVVSLPAACVVQDKEAVRRIEKRGELLDADPTLFAAAYNTLVKARISCRAGLFSKALAFYDEVLESLAEKVIAPNDLSRAGH